MNVSPLSSKISVLCKNQLVKFINGKRCFSATKSIRYEQWKNLRLKKHLHKLTRCASSQSAETIMNVFDRKAKLTQKERVAGGFNGEDASVYDYLKDEFGWRLSDRICDIKRRFPVAVDFGCNRGHLSKEIYGDMVEKLIQCDVSHGFVKNAIVSDEVPTSKLVIDEEFIPFKEGSIDMFASNLSLHWVNDLPGCLRQILQALKNDGVFIGSIFGGDTLYELRVALQLAELEREGGFAPHVSPFVNVNDLGNLMTRAGFTMLTIDTDHMQISYPSMFELMMDLKGMGESSCAWARKSQLHRETMVAAAAIYQEMYGNDRGVPATFNVINFIGWKPDPSQPKAAARGSGEVSLKDINKLDELAQESDKYRRPDPPSDGGNKGN